MDLDDALDEFKKGNRSEEVKQAILQDAYAFLESENFHSALLVIEELTQIPYE